MIDDSVVHTATVGATLGERKMKHECTITLEIMSTPKTGMFKKVAAFLHYLFLFFFFSICAIRGGVMSPGNHWERIRKGISVTLCIH